MTQKGFVLCVAAGTVIAVGTVGLGQLSTPSVKTLTAAVSHSNYANGSSVPWFIFTETVAVRGDGSQVKARHIASPVDGKTIYRLHITDVSAGRRVVVDPVTESLVTYPLGKALNSFAVNGTSACSGQPAGKMLDFDVVLEESQESSGDLRITSRRWVSPQLDCFPLREEIRAVTPGGENLEVRAVNSVTLGAPSAWLFAVPSGYVERTPSQVLAESARRFPKFHDPPDPLTGTHLDKPYWEAQRKK